MNKVIFIIVLFLGVIQFSVLSQSNNQVVLLEQFTDVTCPIYSIFEEDVFGMMEEFQNDLVVIRYHFNDDSCEPYYDDPFYLENTTDASIRSAFYGIDYVPQFYVNGQSNFGLSSSDIVDASEVSTSINLDFSAELNIVENSLSINGTVESESLLAGNLRLHVVVVEETVTLEASEIFSEVSLHHQVMRKMLPSADGHFLCCLEAEVPQNFSTVWDLENIQDPAEVSVIAFVQDATTHEVFQTVKIEPTGVSYYSQEAAIVDLSNSEPVLCDGVVRPKIVLRNGGNSVLESAYFQVRVNDGFVGNYTWEGELSLFEEAEINFPPFGFSLENENNLSVELLEVNGVEDEVLSNNWSELILLEAPEITSNATLQLQTDQFGYETYWEILDSAEEIVYSGGMPDASSDLVPGTYGNSESLSFDFNFIPGECYKFNIYDSYGDGICCEYGNGSYQLVDSFGEVIIQGGEFLYSESIRFHINECANNLVSVAVNPAVGGVLGTAELNFGQTSVDSLLIVWSTGDFGVSVIDQLEPGDYSVFVTDIDGCTSFVEFSIDDEITGINNGSNSSVQEVLLYPNPSSDVIYLEFPSLVFEVGNLHLFNSVGQLVKSVNRTDLSNSKIEINISDLPSGTYYLRYESSNRTVKSIPLSIVN